MRFTRKAEFHGGPLDGREIAVPYQADAFYAPVLPEMTLSPTAITTSPNLRRHVYVRLTSPYTEPGMKINVFTYLGESDG